MRNHRNSFSTPLYAGRFCPFVYRTWITLEERGVPYQYKEVNPYDKEERKQYIAINPKGLIPSILYKGRLLAESFILCEFLEDAYPYHQPDILPVDPYTRAYARIWAENKTLV